MNNFRYSAMLVDDEAIFIDDLGEEISSASSAFKVTKTCTSARQALEAFAEHPCDVVFTDICMPGMDGLQMASALKALDESVIVVFLTAYQKIEYAQKAIRCGGYDFLLKPLEGVQLKIVLENLERTLEKKYRTMVYMALHSIIIKGETDVPDKPLIPLSMAAVSVGQRITIAATEEYTRQIELRQNAIIHDVEAYFDALGVGVIFLSGGSNPNTLYIACLSAVTRDQWLEAFDRIKLITTPYAITFVYNDESAHNSSWPRVISDINHRLDAERLFCESAAICLKQPPPKRELWDTAQLLATMSKAINEKNIQLLARVWESFMNRRADEGLLSSEMGKIASLIVGICHMNITDREKRERAEKRITRAMQEAYNAQTCFSEILDAIIEGVNERDVYRVSNQMLAQRIAQYLRGRMADNISINDVSDHFAYNQAYIYRVFKKVMGKPPMKYLADIRIERAAELLEKNHTLRIQDVGAIVGFSDQYYFSRVFKQVMKKTPSEYQADFLKR